jgi:hypothetical protein
MIGALPPKRIAPDHLLEPLSFPIRNSILISGQKISAKRHSRSEEDNPILSDAGQVVP